MSKVNRDTKPNGWEEFECSGPYCNHERSDKHYIVGEDVLFQAILSAEEMGREEEVDKTRLLVDKTKEEIYKLKPIKTAVLGDENLDLITKYQAVNMINLNGLPYTPLPDQKELLKVKK